MRTQLSRVVSVGFVAIIVAVPLWQTAVELRRGQRPRLLTVLTRPPSIENLRAFESSLQEASVTAKSLRSWMQYVQFFLLRTGERTVIANDGWLFYLPGVQYITQRSVDEPLAANDPLPAIIDFRNQLARRGIHLVLVPVPNKESVYPDRMARLQGNPHIIVPRATRVLLARLQSAGIDVVDLFETFGRARSEQGLERSAELYLRQDTHWSPYGMRLAARTLAQHLLTGRWTVRGQTAFGSRPVTCERRGDLVRMLQVPQIERRVSPETIICQQVIDSTTAPYQDDPDAEVLLLGDSFSRIYQQDEPGSAGFVAHLARELNQPLASIINDGGASTLVRQQLARRPALLKNKRIVIWEFVERDIRYGMEGWQLVEIPTLDAQSTTTALNGN